jgi:hypothetical protein
MVDPHFVVEESDGVTAIVLVCVNGRHTMMNALPQNVPEFEFDESTSRYGFNLNLVLLAPEYITLVHGDGTIKRGRDLPPERLKELRDETTRFVKPFEGLNQLNNTGYRDKLG